MIDLLVIKPHSKLSFTIHPTDKSSQSPIIRNPYLLHSVTMRCLLRLAAAAVTISHFGIQAAPSLALNGRDVECTPATNAASGLYDVHDEKCKGKTCPDGRIGTKVSAFLEAPTAPQSEPELTLYRCKAGFWNFEWNGGCRYEQVYPSPMPTNYLETHKYLRIPTYAGYGDEACCGYYDHEKKTPATCTKPSDYSE